MQFPRLQDTFLRFPLSILSAATAACSAVWMSTGGHGFLEAQSIEKLFAASFLGILLFTGLALLAERERLRSLLIQVLGVPVLYLLAYCVDLAHYDLAMVRFALLFLGSLALIFAGPYLRSKEDRGFWAFSIQVWSRAILAIAVSLIVVAALTLALVSIEQLFKVSIPSYWYESLYAIFLIFVPPLVFLTGIPEDYKALQKEPLKISFRTFATVLSLPLMAVYFVILATYVVKIVVTQVWPSGFVAMPIVVFSVIGFGTYALIFPLLQEGTSRLLQVMTRILLWSLPVFLVVYFVALGQRIGQYGVTELRYLGVALGVLLLGWSLYFNFARKPWLKMIPATLFLGAFLVSFGPWGVFQVSLRSQVARLDGATPQEALEISNYVVEAYGPDFLVQGVRAEDLVQKFDLAVTTERPTNYDFYSEKIDAVEKVEGFDYLIQYNSSIDAQTYALGDKDQVTLQVQGDDRTSLDVTFEDSTLNLPLAGLMDALEKGETTDYVLEAENGVMAVKVRVDNLSYMRDAEGVQGLYFTGTVLVKLR